MQILHVFSKLNHQTRHLGEYCTPNWHRRHTRHLDRQKVNEHPSHPDQMVINRRSDHSSNWTVSIQEPAAGKISPPAATTKPNPSQFRPASFPVSLLPRHLTCMLQPAVSLCVRKISWVPLKDPIFRKIPLKDSTIENTIESFLRRRLLAHLLTQR